MSEEYSSLSHLSGIIENVVYSNDETGYTICQIKADTGEKITVVGNILFAGAGERVDVYGLYTTHPVYGKQFKAERCEKVLPTDEGEIFRYLSSGAIRGIGPKIARKIVDKYGEDTFDIITNHSDWLTEIRGISANKAREIGEDFREKSGVRDILIACQGIVSPVMALNLYQRWGKQAISKIHDNPYQLFLDGNNFKIIDNFANKIGFSLENPLRLEAGISFVLRTYASRDGHTFVHKDVLLDSASKLLSVDKGVISIMVDELLKQDKLKMVNFNGESHIYLAEYYLAEEYIANKLLLLRDLVYSVDQLNIRAFIEQIEVQNCIRYAKMQKVAIEKAISNGITIITGGPGTGKTTIVKALLQIFTKMGLECALCAPTGRAAKKLSESTSHEAKTIHRLLDMHMNPERMRSNYVFGNNEKCLLREDVIVIDESSMVNVLLMRDLLKAVKPGARIILIGDTDQLPAIGEGDVLNGLIKSECFPVVTLDEIFRQGEESGIIFNAHQIKNGIVPDIDRKFNDFFFIKKENENEIPAYIADLCRNRLPKKYGRDIMDEVQIITPVKAGVIGTINVNRVLQDALNPQTPSKAEHAVSQLRTFRVGDRVMQTFNDYGVTWQNAGEDEAGLFNGEVGVIRQIDNITGESIIQFDDRMTKYMLYNYSDLELAYAITVHKSQGSEYPIIIAILPKTSPMMQTRNLIYTAITRASRMVILIGDKATLEKCVENDKHTKKNTGLARILRDGDLK